MVLIDHGACRSLQDPWLDIHGQTLTGVLSRVVQKGCPGIPYLKPLSISLADSMLFPPQTEGTL